MAEKPFKVGQKVLVQDRGNGTIAYVGSTLFAAGKWFGVILEEAKGKNNGTVQGKEYFKCGENFGAFVRQTQLQLLDDSGNPIPSDSARSSPTPSEDKNRSRLSNVRKKNEPTSVRRKSSPAQTSRAATEPKIEKFSSRLSLIGSRSPSDLGTNSPSPAPLKLTTPRQSTENLSSKRASFVEPGKSTPKQGSGIPSLAASKPSKLAPPSNFRQSTSGMTTASGSASTPKRQQSIPVPQTSPSADQTGFVETLKPQFTPGLVLASPGAGMNTSVLSSPQVAQGGGGGDVGERLSHLQTQQENDMLKAQVRDLTEKLDTLKAKRLHDKELLRDFEKTKLQLESMLEFKNRIMESQANLQRDLHRARLETREAIEAKDAHAEEMSELAESMEMATLDKEMAEEKAETLQVELDQAKEKIEELTVDLELLKAQMSETDGSSGSGDLSSATVFKVKQLEQQNARLHETIVRFRDLSAHDKHEFQKLQKDLDQRKSENAELSRTKEKLSSRVEELEGQIADLQEQVDAALGAEEMVEQLADKKMNLEEKVAALEEEVAELEQLVDMNEQLGESARELEVELREEADLARAGMREAQRDKEAALETLADREQTISKFREVVQKLQEQAQDLQAQLERESARPVSKLPEMLDFKKMFAESKAHTRAIDLELRRIEVQESNQHVEYLTGFMPDSFMNRGGDHDAVLVLLLVPRLLWKTEVLLNQVKEKFPNVESIDRASLLRGHTVEQYAFRCRLSHLLFNAQCILHQFAHALNSCSAPTLLKVAAAYPDMAVQEKAIDHFLELLRKDQLDENVGLEGLERCINYFSTMFPILLATEVKVNQSQLIADIAKSLTAAADCLRTDASALVAITKAGDGGDMAALATHLIAVSETLAAQLKAARRRIPTGQQEGAISNMGLETGLASALQDCCTNHATRVTRLIRDVVRSGLAIISNIGDADAGLSETKLRELVTAAASKCLEQEEGGPGPVDSLRTALEFISQQVASLVQVLQDGEYEAGMPIKPEEKPVPPIQMRAKAVRTELEETKLLSQKLEAKEADIKELRLALKAKQEEMSELQLRKDMAERKLEVATKDANVANEKLMRKLEDAQALFKRKEKEFEETMDHLQADIDSLETERGELKDKVKNFAKKAILDTKTAVSSSPTHSPVSPEAGQNSTILTDSPLLMNEIRNLRLALRNQRNENVRLQNQLCKENLESLTPLPVPKRLENGSEDRITDSMKRLDDLSRKASSLLKDVHEAWVMPKVVDITKKTKTQAPLSNQLIEEMSNLHKLKLRTQQLQDLVLTEAVNRRPGCKADADFAIFPSKEMSKALKEEDSIEIGWVKIPFDGPVPPSERNVTVVLDDASLNLLQRKLVGLA
ncbi:dynactin subunit 1 isoform X2 [Thrips palmi]|uniref:Dynactin subunit 1 n=1 Tax=Thrips palmi TaxID=161013 RepID=A0A6P8Y6M5_THRPL|nr:dynactin subunit 1 isoform X2 [Thrips palmi]